jgi:hypothetical protein
MTYCGWIVDNRYDISMTARASVAMRMPKYRRQGGGGRFALRGWTRGGRSLQDIGTGRPEEKVRLRK